jgi:hypothetical protein
MLKPGVWLKAAGREVSIRDGVGHGAPMKKITAREPVWFDSIAPANVAGNNEVFIVDAPRKDSGDTQAVELVDAQALELALVEASSRTTKLEQENEALKAELANLRSGKKGRSE